jgi:hypothetical protein
LHRQIFLDRRGPHVTVATIIEVTRVRVVLGMLMAPVVRRHEGQEARQIAEHSIGSLRFEKGTVPAIVEDDEVTRQKTRRRKSQGQRDPVRNIERQIHDA